MYLVDTSVWVLHFSSKDPLDLRAVCSPDQRVLCLPIYQELLQGIRDESAYRRLREVLDAATFIEDPMTRVVYREAAELFRLARSHGLTVRSSVDCLIAICAIRNNLPVLHRNRDYAALASVSSLREKQL